jgi:hypothetical protein
MAAQKKGLSLEANIVFDLAADKDFAQASDSVVFGDCHNVLHCDTLRAWQHDPWRFDSMMMCAAS